MNSKDKTFTDQEITQPIIPETLDEAIDKLYNQLTDYDFEFIKNPANDFYVYHHGWGQNIRNDWGLWEDKSPLKEDIKKRCGCGEMADDASGIIFCGLFAKVRGLDINKEIEKTAQSFIKHWRAQGINALTMEKIK